MSQITDEDVNILMSQANIDKKTAREILIINNEFKYKIIQW